jgi:hypothetical protein
MKGILQGRKHDYKPLLKMFDIRVNFVFIPLHVSIYHDYHQVVFMYYVCRYCIIFAHLSTLNHTQDTSLKPTQQVIESHRIASCTNTPIYLICTETLQGKHIFIHSITNPSHRPVTSLHQKVRFRMPNTQSPSTLPNIQYLKRPPHHFEC